MLVVTGRIFQNSKLVGYELFDGSQKIQVNRIQAWQYAKVKQILNVVATGSGADIGISGTNGFELKSLPEIQLTPKTSESSEKYTTQDMSSAVVRYEVRNNKVIEASDRRELITIQQSIIQNAINNGEMQSRNRLSPYISVIQTIADNTNPNGNIAVNSNSADNKETEVINILNDFLVEKCGALLLEMRTLLSDGRQSISITECKYVKDPQFIRSTKKFAKAMNLVEGDDCKAMAKKLMSNFGLSDYEASDNITIIDNVITAEDINKYSGMIDEIRNLMDNLKIASLGSGTSGSMLMATTPIIGYVVNNESNEVINITRLPFNTNNMNGQTVQLHPGDRIALSRAEITLLASRPEIGFKLANGKIVSGSVKRHSSTSLYDALEGYFFSFDKVTSASVTVNANGIKVDLAKVVKPEDYKYFRIKNRNSLQAKPVNKTTKAQEIKQKGIFNAFKR